MINSLKEECIGTLCSGKAIFDFTTAVKELIENAIDANATRIDVKLVEYGTQSIQVIDNGCGILKEDLNAVVQKYTTSKLKVIEDLDNVHTFGFRGEALSSICALAGGFCIHTKTEDEPVGSLVKFNARGRVLSRDEKPRVKGTTITVDRMFEALAVRRKDFERNKKRYYTNMVKRVTGYALISRNVKIVVSNAAGSTNGIVLQTQSNRTLEENICNVYGAGFLKTLNKVHVKLELDHGKEEFAIEGFVSKAGHGVGRSDSDRQYFYVNGRPVHIPKFNKVLNEVWRNYEMKHKPACVMDVGLPKEYVDVNVSPDKRDTFLQKENEILNQFRVGLEQIWTPSRGTFHTQSQLKFQKMDSQSSQVSIDLSSSNEIETNVSPEKENTILNKVVSPQPQKNTHSNTNKSPLQQLDQNANQESMDQQLNATNVLHARVKLSNDATEHNTKVSRKRRITKQDVLQHTANMEQFRRNSQSTENNTILTENTENNILDDQAKRNTNDKVIDIDDSDATLEGNDKPDMDAAAKQVLHTKEQINVQCDKQEESKHIPKHVMQRKVVVTNTTPVNEDPTISIANDDHDQYTIKTSLKDILKLRATQFPSCSIQPGSAAPHVPTDCSADPKLGGDLERAASSLDRVLCKQAFLEMEIIGQFNLGFIIVRYGHDLYIVDQHASDEKHTFEKLKRETRIHQQPLLRPTPFDLTAVDEMIVMDKEDIFKRNGFEFVINQNAPVGKKVLLKTIPFSKHIQFGPEDIRELISMISDSPEKEMIFLPKARNMFASRACRTSVMIGTALHREAMTKIIRQLSTLDQPWNCPHGRPTLRHLMDLRNAINANHS